MTIVGDTTTAAKEAAKAETTAEKKEPAKVFDKIEEPTPAPVDDTAKDVANASKLPGRISNTTEGRARINNEEYTQDDLVISPEEKAAFIDAMITGGRYTQEIQLFGGKVTAKLRSRTAEETHAMYAYIRHILAKNGKEGLSAVEGDMAYVPLVAQVAELNGVSYPEMKTPLTYEESDGKEVEPGWYEDFKAWKAKPEGLTSALISCIQLFEYKYWTMTKEASNKNFWNSDTSIAE